MRFIHKLGRTNLSQKYIPIVFDTNLKVIIDFADIKRKKMNEAKQFVFLFFADAGFRYFEALDGLSWEFLGHLGTFLGDVDAS